MSTLELQIWKEDWSLPSVDLACLQTMAYAKFSGAPLKLKKTNNPWRSPTGELPVFNHGSASLTKFEEIANYLKNMNYNADFELSAAQKSDSQAYSHLLREKLLPGLTYAWWIDSKNYIDLTRPWYAKALPLPLNYFIPGQLQRKSRSYLLAKYGLEGEEEIYLENLVLKSSRECLTLLDNRLGDKEFFFGRSPTSLDATVFAYLAPLLKAPFLNCSLQNHLKACDNLSRFVLRILHRYFPDLDNKRTETNSTPSTVDIDEFPNKRRNQFLSGLVAGVAMISYALLSGLVQIDIHQVGDDGEEEADEDNQSSQHSQFSNFRNYEDNKS